MAALTPVLKYADGRAHRCAVYLLTGVNSGDTVDLSADFTKLLAGSAQPMTGSFTIVTAVTGTTVTLTNVSLANDAVYIIVIGASTINASA